MKFFNSVAKCGFKRHTVAAKSGCYSPLGAARSIRLILFIMSFFLCLRPSHPYRRGRPTAAWPPSLSQGAACCSLFIYYLLFFSLLVIYIYAVFMGDTMSCLYLFMRAVGPFRIMLCIDVTVRFFFSCAGTKGLPSAKMPCSVWPQHRIRLEKIAK